MWHRIVLLLSSCPFLSFYLYPMLSSLSATRKRLYLLCIKYVQFVSVSFLACLSFSVFGNATTKLRTPVTFINATNLFALFCFCSLFFCFSSTLIHSASYFNENRWFSPLSHHLRFHRAIILASRNARQISWPSSHQVCIHVPDRSSLQIFVPSSRSLCMKSTSLQTLFF